MVDHYHELCKEGHLPNPPVKGEVIDLQLGIMRSEFQGNGLFKTLVRMQEVMAHEDGYKRLISENGTPVT